MTRSHLFALIACITAGAVLVGVLMLRDSWRSSLTEGPGKDREQAEYDPQRPNQVAYNALRAIPPFELTERDGEAFDSTDLDGEVWVGSFFFASCPEICRNQNAKIAEIQAQLDDEDVTFLSISVDPKHDTPARLREYAKTFGADETSWLFLTGEMEKIKELGSAFAVSIDQNTHASSLMLVDRFGRFRDRFSWDDPRDIERMIETIKNVKAEKTAPFGTTIQSRTIPLTFDQQSKIAYAHGNWQEAKWTKDFLLTERSGERFDSRDMLGKTWVASFFFSQCPSICKQQNLEIQRIAEKLDDLDITFVSITSDPQHDTPQVLMDYSRQFDADTKEWLFLTGEQLHIERIGAERFMVEVAKEQHSSKLLLVDKWGNLRGKFSWQDKEDMTRFRLKVDKVVNQKTPPDKETLEQELALSKPEHGQ